MYLCEINLTRAAPSVKTGGGSFRLQKSPNAHRSQSDPAGKCLQPHLLPSCFIMPQCLYSCSHHAPNCCPSQIHILTVSYSPCLSACRQMPSAHCACNILSLTSASRTAVYLGSLHSKFKPYVKSIPSRLLIVISKPFSFSPSPP